MEMRHASCMWLIALAALSVASGSKEDAVSIRSLLTELDTPSRLAEIPIVEYRQLHTSSYDRAQTDPKEAKTWFANNDYGQFIRTEMRDGKTEWVAMDQSGPGAITHIWTPLLAEKDKMLIRVYLDGEAQPTIEAPFNDLMRGKGIFKSPFAFISFPEKGVESGIGSDLYFPIPFREGCKVTFSELPFYYSFDYRSYGPSASVKSWSSAEMSSCAAMAENVGRRLGREPADAVDFPNSRSVKLLPGGDYKMPLPTGQRALDLIRLTFNSNLKPQELRSLVVSMKFDGEETVWAPIGEFFGAGVRHRQVWDRFRTVNSTGGMSARWTMPYQKSGEVHIRNCSKSTAIFLLEARTSPRKWTDRSMHFHATWRNQADLVTRPFSDWNYLEVQGKGLYIGDTLTVFSPVAGWYGEGDERIYVDGEKFPSHLGTGTEDYYGYAWGMAGKFSSAFISMPERDLPGRENWMGYTTTSRVRGLDGIPFTNFLKFDIEIWDWADCTLAYSATSFWYARPQARSNRVPSPIEAARRLPQLDNEIDGAIEFEQLGVIRKSNGVQVSVQSAGLTKGAWSKGSQLFVQALHPGDSVEIKIPTPKRGPAHVFLYATKSFDYGIVRLTFPGGVSEDVDLWSDVPVATGPIDLGLIQLPSGSFVLKVEVVGANALARGAKAYFGLDCLVLKPQVAK